MLEGKTMSQKSESLQHLDFEGAVFEIFSNYSFDKPKKNEIWEGTKGEQMKPNFTSFFHIYSVDLSSLSTAKLSL
jgi:hypothetical protein